MPLPSIEAANSTPLATPAAPSRKGVAAAPNGCMRSCEQCRLPGDSTLAEACKSVSCAREGPPPRCAFKGARTTSLRSMNAQKLYWLHPWLARPPCSLAAHHACPRPLVSPSCIHFTRRELQTDHPLSVGLRLLAHEGSPDRKSRKCAECLTPSSIASVLRLSIS